MDFWSINWLLIVTIILLIVMVINGYHNGLVKELINFVSLIVISIAIVLISVLVRSFSDKQVFNTVASIILLLILIIAYKLLNIVFASAKLFSKVPAVHGINKLFGAAFGIAETAVALWVVFCLMELFDMGPVGTRLYSYVTGNEFMTYFYQHNLIQMWGEKIIGHPFVL